MPTEFNRWRKLLSLTQDEAATRLGVSRSQIINWDRGEDRTRGRPSVPPYAVRCLMHAMVLGKEVGPWPE